MRRLAVVLTLTLITGCATAPDKIAPQYISDLQYMELSCEQMAAEQSRLATALAEASRAQSGARSGDAWGVLLLGVPTASLSGSNQASYVARLKGELEALQRAAVKKECGLETLSAEQIIESTKSISSAEMKERKSKSTRERMMGK